MKKYLDTIRSSITFFSESTANFVIHGLSFRGKMSRRDFFTGIIGLHFLLFLLLPFLLANSSTINMLAAAFCMFLTFICSLSAGCRRVNDAGGYWFFPLIPLAVYILFYVFLFAFHEFVSKIVVFIFFGLFSVSFVINMYWVCQPTKKDRS